TLVEDVNATRCEWRDDLLEADAPTPFPSAGGILPNFKVLDTQRIECLLHLDRDVERVAMAHCFVMRRPVMAVGGPPSTICGAKIVEGVTSTWITSGKAMDAEISVMRRRHMLGCGIDQRLH